jgi:hypothetical protein
MPLLAHRLLALNALLLSGTAFAGFSVQQKVSNGGADKTPADFTWTIGEQAFRLDVKRGADVRSFVFNGRVFYVCGRLDKARIDAVKKADLQDKPTLASLEKGACQDLSTDFGMRFFLAPYDAVFAVDSTAGFSGSLDLAADKIELAGSVGAADKIKCVNFTRTYTVSDRKRLGVEQELEETACNAPAINWRTAFARQLGMTLIRQPNGKVNFQTLSIDLKKMPGMTVQANGRVSGKDAAGKATSRPFTVETTRVREADPKPAELGFPAGFEVLDADALVVAAAKSPAHKGAAPARSGLELVDLVKALILGASPASVLLSEP